VIFVFDLDDTVCDTDSYSEYYINNFIKKHDLPYKQIAKNTRFAEAKFNWDTETALAWYKERGDEMMANFPCKKNAVTTINKLYDSGHTIIIATARANDWHTNPEEITLNWLKKHGIKYHKIYIGRIDKEAICEEVNADVFVDDDIKTTQRVADFFKTCKNSRKKSFLMTTEYNQNLEISNNILRVKDFNDFETKLKEIGAF